MTDYITDCAIHLLYDVPRNSVISLVEDPNNLIFFDHIDGMYSYCTNEEGIFHLAAWSEVFIWNLAA